MPSLTDIAAYIDERLDVTSIPDYPGAMNGVQFANTGDIARVATAVDYSTHTIRAAVEAGATLLLVHHGMFWGGAQPVVAQRYEQYRKLIAHDMAVYSAHLPLDAHAEIGNNVLLARQLGLTPKGGFARYQSIAIGVSGDADLPTATIVAAAREFAAEHGGSVVSTPFEPGRITNRWGICTGAGASSATLREAVEQGIDTLIVGEGPHHTAVEARDLGIVVVYAGHYATETLGIRALGEDVARRFRIETSFIAAPTGL